MTKAYLLLADPSPCLRLLVLRELLGRPEDDPEVQELLAMRDDDPLVSRMVALQSEDGSWDAGALQATAPRGVLYTTCQALTRLGYLGFGHEHLTVRRAGEYVFSQQQEDGSWPLPQSSEGAAEREGYSMAPLQTAIPLASLAICGLGTDPRAERAYEWLLQQRLDDGAWPTGIASGVYRYVAGYRRLPHSRWGCRSNTTGALACLAHHPLRGSSQEARRALELLLARETRERHTLGYEVARRLGAEDTRGFFTYYARFDLAWLLDLCWRVGATLEDPRVADLVSFVLDLQGPYGLWEYGPKPQVSRWVTFDLLRTLSRLDDEGDWLSLEPRTPFRPYPTRQRRY